MNQEYEKDIQLMQTQRDTLRAQLEELDGSQNRQRALQTRVTIHAAELQRLLLVVDRCEKQMEQQRSEMAEAKDAQRALLQIKELKQLIVKKDETIANLQAILESGHSREESVKQTLKELETMRDSMRERQLSFRQELGLANDEINELRAKVAQLEPLTNQLEEKKQENEALSQRVSELEKQLAAQAEENVSSLDAAKTQLLELGGEREERMKELEQAHELNAALSIDKKELTERIASLEAQLSREAAEKELARSNLAETQKQCAAASAALEKMKEDANYWQQLSEQADFQLEKARTDMESLQARLGEQTSIIQQLNELNDENRILKEQLQTQQAQLQDLQTKATEQLLASQTKESGHATTVKQLTERCSEFEELMKSLQEQLGKKQATITQLMSSNADLTQQLTRLQCQYRQFSEEALDSIRQLEQSNRVEDLQASVAREQYLDQRYSEIQEQLDATEEELYSVQKQYEMSLSLSQEKKQGDDSDTIVQLRRQLAQKQSQTDALAAELATQQLRMNDASLQQELPELAVDHVWPDEAAEKAMAASKSRLEEAEKKLEKIVDEITNECACEECGESSGAPPDFLPPLEGMEQGDTTVQMERELDAKI